MVVVVVVVLVVVVIVIGSSYEDSSERALVCDDRANGAWRGGFARWSGKKLSITNDIQWLSGEARFTGLDCKA